METQTLSDGKRPCPKFTPGPWEIRRQGNIIAGENGGAFVCDLNGVIGHDANLIAAAPELYEALELADALLRGANMNRSVVERKVAAALAKAHGQ